jgi:hypothetical protein
MVKPIWGTRERPKDLYEIVQISLENRYRRVDAGGSTTRRPEDSQALPQRRAMSLSGPSDPARLSLRLFDIPL